MENENFPKIRPGDIIRHFKRDLCTQTEKEHNQYLCQVLGIARHTESGEELLIYQSLYDNFKIWARPLSMVFEPVDKIKYPDAKQEHRLEIVGNITDGWSKD